MSGSVPSPDITWMANHSMSTSAAGIVMIRTKTMKISSTSTRARGNSSR